MKDMTSDEPTEDVSLNIEPDEVNVTNSLSETNIISIALQNSSEQTKSFELSIPFPESVYWEANVLQGGHGTFTTKESQIFAEQIDAEESKIFSFKLQSKRQSGIEVVTAEFQCGNTTLSSELTLVFEPENESIPPKPRRKVGPDVS